MQASEPETYRGVWLLSLRNFVNPPRKLQEYNQITLRQLSWT